MIFFFDNIKQLWRETNGAQQKTELLSKFMAIATAFVFPLSTTLLDFLLLATIIVNLLAGDLKRKFSAILHNPISLMLMMFFAFYVIGMFYSDAPFQYVFTRLGKYDKFLWGALLFPVFYGEDKWRDYAIRFFLISMGIALILSYFKAFGLLHYDTWHGPVEIFKDHIAFNFLLSFTVYLLLLEIVRTKDKLWRILLAIYLALAVYDSVFMCTSRTGYFVLAGLLFLFFIQRLRWKGIILAVAAVLILAGSAFYFSPVFKGRVAEIYSDMKVYNSNKVTSLGMRRSFWENGVKIIKLHPIIGTGTGSIKHEYSVLRPVPPFTPANPHDEYMAVAIQLGLVGLAYLLFMFAMQFWYSRYLRFPFKNIAQGIVLAIAIGSFANSWLTDSTQVQLYVYLLALTFSGLNSAPIIPKIAVKYANNDNASS